VTKGGQTDLAAVSLTCLENLGLLRR